MAQGSFVKEEMAQAPALERDGDKEPAFWHRWIERRPVQMLIASLFLLGVGTAIELVPTFLVKSNIPTIASVQPYTALELEGRDIYIREGCYTCHSQMVRPFRSETERYGEYSKAGEYVYDHPFQWGSKRIGPDLWRVGGKYSDSWHYRHMFEPADISPGTIMPTYKHMYERDLNTSYTEKKIKVMRTLGVPYPEGYEGTLAKEMDDQATAIAQNLVKDEVIKPEAVEKVKKWEIIAMIAYLQRIGTDIKKQPADGAGAITQAN
jgi:cytochrome c oxidase cbb3-type subunit I/II